MSCQPAITEDKIINENERYINPVTGDPAKKCLSPSAIIMIVTFFRIVKRDIDRYWSAYVRENWPDIAYLAPSINHANQA